MRNKGFFWFLTILVAIVCVYQISFTFVVNRVEKDAEKFAAEQVDSLKNSVSSLEDKTVVLPNGRALQLDNTEAEDIATNYYTNEYLSSRGDKKVSWTGATYNEAKSRGINLGLDLKGGMSVTLEVSIPDLVKNEVVNPRNARFVVPYEKAVAQYRSSGGDFIDLFIAEYSKANSGRDLIDDFYSSSNSEILARNASNEEVETYLRNKVAESLDGVENIMNRRINQFGVAQPNIQKDANSNRIYIELPGVKDKNTVRQKLQSTANLEFFETHPNVTFGSFIEQAEKLLNEKYGVKKESTAGDTEPLNLDLASDNTPDSTDNQDTSVDTTENKPLLAFDDTTEQISSDDTTAVDQIDPNTSVLFSKVAQLGDFSGSFHTEILLYAEMKDTSAIGRMFRDKDVKALLPVSNVKFMWASSPQTFDFKNQPSKKAYALHAIKIPDNGRAAINGNDIDRASQDFDG